MAFNPLEHPGIPLDDQIRDWGRLDVAPVDPDGSDPYTRCRVVTMNAIEVEASQFSHHFSRVCPDLEAKQQLAKVRYVEQQQQKVVNWLLPGQASVLETTLTYEQAATDLTGWVARTEPDPRLRAAYQFGVLEDFDHLYRYANLYEIVEHREAEKVVGRFTEMMPGRPAHQQHRDPMDDVREPYDRELAAPLSKLHALTVLSAEQQMLNFYVNMGPLHLEPVARRLYQEIAMVEEAHVTHYESLQDPGETWWERLVNHEYNECYLYYSFMQTETDPRIRGIWELHLNMELEHLHIACDMMRRQENRDPEALLPWELPEPVAFEPNKEFVRELLAAQVDHTTLGTGIVPEAHEWFEDMQDRVNAERPPTETVIDDHCHRFGGEYRLETEGPHPIPRLRDEPYR